MDDKKTLGQLVDSVADKFFAQGMDSYHASKFALIYVLSSIISLESAVSDFLSKFNGGNHEN